MPHTITIDPVTRIESHGKITIKLDDAGLVPDAKFQVLEFRGFEKFCVGRIFSEMPAVTMRICGTCPVSHMLASAKACDAILGTRVPPAANKLRRLINYAQYVQSHAFSFFFLSAPDLLLGMESDPAVRNLVGLIREFPEFAMQGIKLRAFGQNIIRMLSSRAVHPDWAVPGGVRDTLSSVQIENIRQFLPEAFETVETAVNLLKDNLPDFMDEIKTYGDFPSLFIGLVSPEGGLEHYDGVLRVMDADGRILDPGVSADKYWEVISEAFESWSYMKFAFYKPGGYGNGAGLYRVGPLARINICDFAGTPRADREIRRFRRLNDSKPVSGSFYTHYARLIELLFALEKIEELIEDHELFDPHIRAIAGPNNPVGVGVVEAPRGTIIHEYNVDEDGIITKARMIVSTANNNQAINRTVLQVAQAYMTGKRKITEGLMNRVEHGVRIYI